MVVATKRNRDMYVHYSDNDVEYTLYSIQSFPSTIYGVCIPSKTESWL